MAINVNTVYNTVLSILNKEQRGYITPGEFNKLATQVQLEIFESYFEDLNQQLRVPQKENEYTDRRKNIDECISIFKTIGTPQVVNAGSVLTLTLLSAGTGYTTAQNVATTGGGTGLTLNITTQLPLFNLSNSGTGYSISTNVPTTGGTGSGLTVNINSIDGNGAITGISVNNPGLGYVTSDVLTINAGNTDAQITLTTNSNGEVLSATVNQGGSNYDVGNTITVDAGDTNATFVVSSVNESLYFLPPSNLHRIGTVIYKDEKEIERINRNDLLQINLSPLTKPTTKYPLYLYEQATPGSNGVSTGQSHIIVYPNSITSASDIKISYIRKPNDVNWGFTVGSLGQYMYNQQSSTNFELLATEQTEVILRILSYAGVIIKDPQVVQSAANAVQAEKINSKS